MLFYFALVGIVVLHTLKPKSYGLRIIVIMLTK